MQNERDLGSWILPQPLDDKVWVSIPRHPGSRFIPFGYKESETDPEMLDPIPLELEALEKAKKYLKQYSFARVSAWLTKTTGREITRDGLNKRIKGEIERKRKATYYRNLARRIYKALEKAKAYEERLGKEGDTTFFYSDFYTSLASRVDAECTT